MPRVNHIAKCRKSPGSCGRCGDTIETGQPYIWWAFRYGGKHIRCTKPGCKPRASELTQSEFLSTLYATEEGFSAAAEQSRKDGKPDAFVSALQDAQDELENLGSECEDKFNNMPDGLQQGDTGQLLEERSSRCSDLASECETLAEEIEQAWKDRAEEKEEGDDDGDYLDKLLERQDELDFSID